MKTLRFNQEIIKAFDNNFEHFIYVCRNKGFDAFHCVGDLDLKTNPLMYIPNNFTVEGYLSLWGCENLRSIGDDVKIGGFLNLAYSSVRSIGENVSVGGDLYLENTSITELPKSMTVRYRTFFG